MSDSNDRIIDLKARIDTRLDNVMWTMKPNRDDSVTGFNEAWDIVDKAFVEELQK